METVKIADVSLETCAREAQLDCGGRSDLTVKVFADGRVFMWTCYLSHRPKNQFESLEKFQEFWAKDDVANA